MTARFLYTRLDCIDGLPAWIWRVTHNRGLHSVLDVMRFYANGQRFDSTMAFPGRDPSLIAGMDSEILAELSKWAANNPVTEYTSEPTPKFWGEITPVLDKFFDTRFEEIDDVSPLTFALVFDRGILTFRRLMGFYARGKRFDDGRGAYIDELLLRSMSAWAAKNTWRFV